MFQRLHQSPNVVLDGQSVESEVPLDYSFRSDMDQLKSIRAGSVYSDSGISCGSSRHRGTNGGLGTPGSERRGVLLDPHKIYDDTSSIRSHTTAKSSSTYRSGDISASVSTYKPFLMSNTKAGVAALNGHQDSPFEKFIEVLLASGPPLKGKQSVPVGFEDDYHLWSIFTSSRLNLKIPPDQVRTMRDWFYAQDHNSPDLTTEFISSIRELITHLSRERPLFGPPWIAIIDHNSQELFFNRVTGEARYDLPKDFPTISDMDVFGRTIHEMFYSVVSRGINHITLPQFDEICASKKYNFSLSDTEKTKLLKAIVKTLNEEQVIFYEDFVPIGRALLLKWYRQQYPKGGDWLKLSSKRYGFFYLNKMTGETTFRPAQYEREQLSLYLQETLKEVDKLKETVSSTSEEKDGVVQELEKSKLAIDDWENQVESLKIDVEKLQSEIHNNKDSYNALLNKYGESMKALEGVREELQQAEETNISLKKDKSSLQEEVDENREMLERNDIRITALLAEHDTLRDQIASANAIANAKESENAGLLFDYDEERKEHDKTRQDLEETKESLEKDITELELKLCASEENNKNLFNAGVHLQTQIDNLTSEKRELEDQVKKLEQELQIEQERSNELEQAVEKQCNKNTMMDADLKTFKEQHLTAKNNELTDALGLIAELKTQLAYQQEEVKTLRIKHSSKAHVFAQQSEDTHKLKEYISKLEERDGKHAEVLKEAVLRAGKILRKAHARENTPVSLTRVQSCPELDQPFPAPTTIQSVQKRKVKQCWTGAASSTSLGGTRPHISPPRPRTSTPNNICQIYTDSGDITLCTREREKVVIMREDEKVKVRSLKAPKDDSYLHHTRPFSPTCTCESCRKLIGADSACSSPVRPSTGGHKLEVPLSVGDRVRCRSVRPGYQESRVSEGIVEFIGKRKNFGKALFVGVNLGVPLGNTDGCVDGERLFRCHSKHGILVSLHNVLAVFSLKTQTFVPLMLGNGPGGTGPACGGNAGPKRRRPKSANNMINSNKIYSSVSTISVDERFVRSPYLQSLIAVDPYSPEFKALNGSFEAVKISKPRISRPIPRQKAKNRSY